MSFQIGCAIWAYKGWTGDLFPPKSRSSDFLNLYSRRFTCVEGNTTFYSIPTPETVARWASETPDGFKFCPKLPKTLTHNGRLEPFLAGAIDFLHLMQGLGDRLGPIFAQLPPSYSPAQVQDLAKFLRGWSQTKAPIALEVRHADWFREPHKTRLNDLLTELQIGRVLLDTRPIYECDDDPQLESERKKPQVPLQPDVTSNFTIVRYISHPNRQLNQQYLDEWVHHINDYLKRNIHVYFFVHCPVEEHSPGTARYFQSLLESHHISVPPLPWNEIQEPEEPTSQLTLF